VLAVVGCQVYTGRTGFRSKLKADEVRAREAMHKHEVERFCEDKPLSNSPEMKDRARLHEGMILSFIITSYRLCVVPQREN
jgi:hypothetical protein